VPLTSVTTWRPVVVNPDTTTRSVWVAAPIIRALAYTPSDEDETLVPLHWPPAPFATGAVANGTYIDGGVPTATFVGPVAEPHQLHVATIVLGVAIGHEKAMGRKDEVKSFVVAVRLLGVVVVLWSLTAVYVLETELFDAVTVAPPPPTRIPTAAFVMEFCEIVAVVADVPLTSNGFGGVSGLVTIAIAPAR
jgi:hypothetical protein